MARSKAYVFTATLAPGEKNFVETWTAQGARSRAVYLKASLAASKVVVHAFGSGRRVLVLQ